MQMDEPFAILGARGNHFVTKYDGDDSAVFGPAPNGNVGSLLQNHVVRKQTRDTDIGLNDSPRNCGRLGSGSIATGQTEGDTKGRQFSIIVNHYPML
jgi:hypothetical protein